MKVVMVDDEQAALDALQAMIAKHGNEVKVVGTALTALEGIKVIQREKPDLVLLDIEMPHGSGFDLLDAFPQRGFEVVYTTAHEEHAVRAAHTHPFDYLLKPVDPDDLERCLNELMKRQGKSGPRRIEIASLHGRVYLWADQILHIEADGGYSTVHTVLGEQHVASKSIGHFEEILPKDAFFRCHHSHLIQLNMVRAYDGSDGGAAILTNGRRVPLATRRVAEFLALLKA